MENILDTIMTVAGALIAMIMAYVAPKLKAWLAAKTSAAEADKLYALITVLVQSAEQLYWNKTGAERKAYVVEQLKKLNMEVSTEIDAYIESAVYELPDGDK